MVDVLQSKRDSSRFQILVEIAANQPNVRQKEVAERLGVLPRRSPSTSRTWLPTGLSYPTGG